MTARFDHNLNRPDKLNAFTAEMHLALRAALEAGTRR